MKRKTTMGTQAGRSVVVSAASAFAFGFQSELSVVSAVTMSSTARVTPPSKSPFLNRGAAALAMMSFDVASVSTPSSP